MRLSSPHKSLKSLFSLLSGNAVALIPLCIILSLRLCLWPRFGNSRLRLRAKSRFRFVLEIARSYLNLNLVGKHFQLNYARAIIKGN